MHQGVRYIVCYYRYSFSECNADIAARKMQMSQPRNPWAFSQVQDNYSLYTHTPRSFGMIPTEKKKKKNHIILFLCIISGNRFTKLPLSICIKFIHNKETFLSEPRVEVFKLTIIIGVLNIMIDFHSLALFTSISGNLITRHQPRQIGVHTCHFHVFPLWSWLKRSESGLRVHLWKVSHLLHTSTHAWI